MRSSYSTAQHPGCSTCELEIVPGRLPAPVRGRATLKVNEIGIIWNLYRALEEHGAIRAAGEETDSGQRFYLAVRVTYHPHPPI